MRRLTATLFLLPFAALLSCERGAAQDPSTQSAIAPPVSRTFPAPRIELAPGARKVFVSNRFGDDRNGGTTPELPVKTIKRGKALLRKGTSDWLLLRRGDTFREPVGRWRWPGRSAKQPALLGAYGKGVRPKILTGKQGGLFTNEGGGSPKRLDHVVIQGLHFYADTRDPRSPTFVGSAGQAGLFWLVGGTGLVIDDCVFQSYPVGIVLQDFGRRGLTDVVIRRTQLLDSYAVGAHAQGLFAEGVDGLTIEGCLFDHNGWNSSVKGAQGTIYNHNVYIQSNCRRATLRRNIILRGASHGAQVRCGGVVEENLFAQNAIGLLIGGGTKPVPGGVTGSVKGNVILEGTDIRKDLPRGWGLDLANIKQADVSDLIVANVRSTGRNVRSVATNANTTFKNIIVHAWSGNDQFVPRTDWHDPGRSLASYRGGKGFEQVVAKLRAQGRHAWDPNYSAGALIGWIRAGFRPR